MMWHMIQKIKRKLKKNKCPQCTRSFLKSIVPRNDDYIECSCGFIISIQEYRSFINHNCPQRALDFLRASNVY